MANLIKKQIYFDPDVIKYLCDVVESENEAKSSKLNVSQYVNREMKIAMKGDKNA